MTATTLDPYATLGIPVGASRDEAARAHRRLAKAFHPDINPGPAAAERMRRINEAWRILSNPARRSRYDAERQPATAWAGATTWGGSPYASRTRSATWTTWPESRVAPGPRVRRPSRPDPVEPSFGDRPLVFFAVSAILALLYFIGAWLGSI
ncbi:MAG: J domain-containing protein [Chloroflexota bacterium]|nr:J domain-containing protein [Chloroflexota bacterium]